MCLCEHQQVISYNKCMEMALVLGVHCLMMDDEMMIMKRYSRAVLAKINEVTTCKQHERRADQRCY